MSALPKLTEDIYAVRQEMFEKGRGYLRALITLDHEPINFSIGSGRVLYGLNKYLPPISGFEDEKQKLCQRIARYAYEYAASEYAQAVNFKITISRNSDELLPPTAVEEGEIFIAADIDGHLRQVYLPPYHPLMDASAMRIAAGITFECRVINPGYHRLSDDRKKGGPGGAASTLPNMDPLYRERDSLVVTEEQWPPPFLVAHGEIPHEPPEIGIELPPEVVVPLIPFATNEPSKPEASHEEDFDFEEGPESAPPEMERALAAIAASHTPAVHAEPVIMPSSVARSAPEASPLRTSQKIEPMISPATHPAPSTHPAPVAATRGVTAAPTAHPQNRVAAPISPAPTIGQPKATAQQQAFAPEARPASARIQQQVPQERRVETPAPQVSRAPKATPEPHTQPPETARNEPAQQPETPRAEPESPTESPASRAEPANETEAPRNEPRREPEQSPSEQNAQTGEATRQPSETNHSEPARRTETETPEPVQAAETQPTHASRARTPEQPHPAQQQETVASSSAPQHEYEQRTIKLAEKEELAPHAAHAGFAPQHGLDARQEASFAPAYTHLLDVPTHHHVYDALQPAQTKVADLAPATLLQTKMADVAKPTPTPITLSAPKQPRLTRSAFLKRLLAPGMTPMPGGEPPEEV